MSYLQKVTDAHTISSIKHCRKHIFSPSLHCGNVIMCMTGCVSGSCVCESWAPCQDRIVGIEFSDGVCYLAPKVQVIVGVAILLLFLCCCICCCGGQQVIVRYMYYKDRALGIVPIENLIQSIQCSWGATVLLTVAYVAYTLHSLFSGTGEGKFLMYIHRSINHSFREKQSILYASSCEHYHHHMSI